jgi:hypothetical protein
MFGSGSMGQKVDDDVDFPLDGFDLGKHCLGEASDGGKLIYDCYAVSNHMGGMGGGHYTAYCRNGDRWYDFDDFHVAPIKKEAVENTVVTSSAYNIFYRRRDWHENNLKNGIDFEALENKPDLSFLD